MTKDLSGKTALVTGSTSGIGRAVAAELGRRGAHVIVSGRDAERGEKAVAELRADGAEADFVAADLGDAASARDLARRAAAVTGQVDILVNNAGVYSFAPTDQTTEETFDATYNLNVKVPYFLVAELAPAMVERGGGAIVNVSTALAVKGVPGASVYGSSKGAINTLTRDWAAEYGPRGVRVNAVSPGVIDTEGVDRVMGDGADGFVSGIPAARKGTSEEVAEAVAYLASASFVHGANLAVDGGGTAI